MWSSSVNPVVSLTKCVTPGLTHIRALVRPTSHMDMLLYWGVSWFSGTCLCAGGTSWHSRSAIWFPEDLTTERSRGSRCESWCDCWNWKYCCSYCSDNCLRCNNRYHYCTVGTKCLSLVDLANELDRECYCRHRSWRAVSSMKYVEYHRKFGDFCCVRIQIVDGRRKNASDQRACLRKKVTKKSDRARRADECTRWKISAVAYGHG